MIFRNYENFHLNHLEIHQNLVNFELYIKNIQLFFCRINQLEINSLEIL